MSKKTRSLISERRHQIGALDTLTTLCESAGYEFAPGITSDEFLSFVANEILEGELDEALGVKIKAAFHKAAGAFKAKPKAASASAPKHEKPKMWTPGAHRALAART